MQKLPYSKLDDYTEEQAAARRAAILQQTGVHLKHVGQYSIQPSDVSGNIEMFTGCVQVPLGFAGPLLMDGEHAQGSFLIPMATSEGTLLASYNRGMKIASLAGGVKTTVIDDGMQRGAGFTFVDARAAYRFGKWIEDNYDTIQSISEQTTSIGKLLRIEQYPVGKIRFIRFNYYTGDAAGQNMVNKAAHRACQWILKHQPEELEAFKFGSQFDSDKKHSLVNALTVRGKKVVAECTIPRQLMTDIMRTTPEAYQRFKSTSTLEAFMAGAVSNASHIANGVAAMFVATGQDEANVAESSAGYYHGEINKEGDLYISITIPALIVATYGGGTGLPTQKECLQVMDCYGAGKVLKFAEIVTAVALCGELSLGSAILADEFVSSHDKLGRNRP